MDKWRSRVSGATLIEFALVLPLIIGLMFAGFFFVVYAVTQLAFSFDTTRIAERAIRVVPQDDQGVYRGAICNFIEPRLEEESPFYASYVEDIKTLSVKTSGAQAGSGQSIITIKRKGTFNLLNSQKWGLPNKIVATGAAPLSADAGSGECSW